MLVGLHLDTIHVSADLFVGLFQGSAGECRREYMARAQKRKRVQGPHWSRQRSRSSRQYLSPASKRLRRMQEELHFNLEVPSSSPGRALASTVAQRVEHQTPVRGCCFSDPCRRSSEQEWE